MRGILRGIAANAALSTEGAASNPRRLSVISFAGYCSINSDKFRDRFSARRRRQSDSSFFSRGSSARGSLRPENFHAERILCLVTGVQRGCNFIPVWETARQRGVWNNYTAKRQRKRERERERKRGEGVIYKNNQSSKVASSIP
jgi:hypothetical protein